MKIRPALLGVFIALTFSAATQAQEEGSTPGAIPDPGSYQGSTELQRQEQQQDAQVEQQNQQMLQRLNENYQQYAPAGSGAGGSAGGAGQPTAKRNPPVDWWSKSPLQAANNPLLGRWQQVAPKAISGQQLAGAAVIPGAGDVAASLLNSTLAGGCKSMFGSGVVAFEPDKLQWVTPDGHEEILNNVAYRASGSEVVVLSRDPGAIPALIFGFSTHDHALVAFFNCRMDRVGAKAVAASPAPSKPGASSAAKSPVGSPVTVPATAGPATGGNSKIQLQVGISAPGSLTPLPGITLWVSPDNPADAMSRAKLLPPGASLTNQLVADCANSAACNRDLQVMTAKALGSVITDAAGHALTPPVPAGRYYVMGMAAYNGKVIFWNQPVDVESGTVNVTLDQNNGAAAAVGR